MRPSVAWHVPSEFGRFASFIPNNVEILNPLTPLTRLYGFLIYAPIIILLAFIFLFFVKLFKSYERLEIFSLSAVNHIKRIGYLLLAIECIKPGVEFLLSMVLTWHNPPGHRYAIVSVSDTDLTTIFIAFIIILVSWIMSEGSRLKEEESLTI
jgi:hypothetical protein